MDIKISIFESSNYTNYSFENELKKALDEIGYRVLSFSYEAFKEKMGFFRRKEVDMILMTMTIDGEYIEDLDEFEVVSTAIFQASVNLSIDLFGIE